MSNINGYIPQDNNRLYQENTLKEKKDINIKVNNGEKNLSEKMKEAKKIRVIAVVAFWIIVGFIVFLLLLFFVSLVTEIIPF